MLSLRVAPPLSRTIFVFFGFFQKIFLALGTPAAISSPMSATQGRQVSARTEAASMRGLNQRSEWPDVASRLRMGSRAIHHSHTQRDNRTPPPVARMDVCALVLVIAIGVLLAWVSVHQVRPDPQVRQFLSSPAVEEQFRRQRDLAVAGRAHGAPQAETSPLVSLAQAFAHLLNPPAPRPPPGPSGPPLQSPARPDLLTPEFKLLATSFYPARPAESVALVSEPGSGFRWVKPGERLGHVVVDQIRSGVLVYRDADRFGEVQVEKVSISTSIVQDKANPSEGRPTPKKPQKTSSRPPSETGIGQAPVAIQIGTQP